MAILSHVEVESALRGAIDGFFKAGKAEELTLRRVRSVAGEALGVGEDFFKTDAGWKDKSKQFIHEEVDRRVTASSQAAQASTPSKPPPANSPKAQSSSPSKKAGNATTKPSDSPIKVVKSNLKRKSLAAQSSPAKRTKTAVISDDDDEDAHDSDDSFASKSDTPPPSKTKRPQPVKKTKKNVNVKSDADSDSDNSSRPKKKTPPSQRVKATAPKLSTTLDSDSDSLSSVLDDPPPKKKSSQKPKSSPPSKASAKPRASTTSAATTSTTPATADEEIKRLQGWLIKCGIRKLWHRELAPFTTPKAKIAHLKSMLSDAGMDGRYSVEKARLIREKRELLADLEAVQEGERRWGTADADVDAEAGSGRSAGRRTAVSARRLEERLLLESDEESD